MFNPERLYAVAQAGHGFTMHRYRTEDALAEVLAPGYFEPAREIVRDGDVVVVTAGHKTPDRTHVLVVVNEDEGDPLAVSVMAAPAELRRGDADAAAPARQGRKPKGTGAAPDAEGAQS